MVYLVKTIGGNTCKIGYSKNPKLRLSGIQTGSDKKAYIDGVLCGDMTLEKELHKKFSHLRVSGEWFRCSKDIDEEFGVEEVFLVSQLFLDLMKKIPNISLRVFCVLIERFIGKTFKVTAKLKNEIADELDLARRTLEKKTIFDELIENNAILSSNGWFYINPKVIQKKYGIDVEQELKRKSDLMQYNK